MTKKNAALKAIISGGDEAEETIRAIYQGEVDAFVIGNDEGRRVYTLEGADLPYSLLVERMEQGAVILDAGSTIVYCNPSLERLIGSTRETLIGLSLRHFLHSDDHALFEKLWAQAFEGPCDSELSLTRSDGNHIAANLSFRLLTRDKSSVGVLITDLTPQKKQAELTSRIQQLQDDERRRIARELHDSVGQLLAAVSMNFTRVEAAAAKLPPDVAKLVAENAVMVNQISAEIRTISHLLHPPLLDEVGLPAALRWYTSGFAERSNIRTTLDIPEPFERLPSDVEIVVFRAIQECLTNIHRHSNTNSCSVKISQDAELLRIEVKDSGRGIPESKLSTLSSSGGVGLRGLHERIRPLRGNLEIKSSASGTAVVVTLPIPRDRGSSASNGQNVA